MFIYRFDPYSGQNKFKHHSFGIFDGGVGFGDDKNSKTFNFSKEYPKYQLPGHCTVRLTFTSKNSVGYLLLEYKEPQGKNYTKILHPESSDLLQYSICRKIDTSLVWYFMVSLYQQNHSFEITNFEQTKLQN